MSVDRPRKGDGSTEKHSRTGSGSRVLNTSLTKHSRSGSGSRESSGVGGGQRGWEAEERVGSEYAVRTIVATDGNPGVVSSAKQQRQLDKACLFCGLDNGQIVVIDRESWAVVSRCDAHEKQVL
jgi:hypothetical protein